MRTTLTAAATLAAVLLAAGPAEGQATCTFTDDPIVADETPIRAEHINEIRDCLKQLLAGGTTVPPPVVDQCPWQAAGRGEAVVDVPACVDWVRVFVGPVEPFVRGNRQISDITIYMRSTLDFDAWRRIVYGRLNAGACAAYGQACTVEASVGIGNAVQLAVTQEDAPIQIEWTFTGIDEPQLPDSAGGRGLPGRVR